jgi:RND family efflux transporter MFP subunit
MRLALAPHLWLFPLLVAAIAGCGERNQYVAPPPPEVTVAQPVSQTVGDFVEFTGTTRPTATVDLRARVTGFLRQIAFEDGATVQEGDLLFVIEPKPFRVALQAVEAERQKAQASLQLEKANYERIAELVQLNSTSQQEVEIQQAKLATAQANVASSEAAVTLAEQNVEYTEIRAPITGRIGRHLVDVGNLVEAETTLLATIESIDPIHAYFHISESELLRFREMLRQNKLPDPETSPPELELKLANESDYSHRGLLDFRQLGVDSRTGTVMRRGSFPNPDQELIPGLFVRVRAALGKPAPKLLVDSRALVADQRGDSLLIVGGENEVEQRPVKLGIRVGRLQVIEKGIAPEEWVVINGLQRARPGAKVDPQKSAMPAVTPEESAPGAAEEQVAGVEHSR